MARFLASASLVASSSRRTPLGRSGSDNGNQVGGHVLLEELSSCCCGGLVARNLHMKVRRAEKPPAGKAAELVLGGSWGDSWLGHSGVEHGRDCVGPGLGRVGPAVLYLLVRTDWRL